MNDVGSCSNPFWTRQNIMVENIKHNSFEQKLTSVIIVSKYWVISRLTRHMLVEEHQTELIKVSS
jgi:hypothetical protein